MQHFILKNVYAVNQYFANFSDEQEITSFEPKNTRFGLEYYSNLLFFYEAMYGNIIRLDTNLD